LAAELKSKIGSESTLIRGDNGVFDVVVDGDLVFSKDKVGRFPDDGEICRVLGVDAV